MSQPLYPQEKNPCYPLDRRLGGPESWSACSGKEKKSQPLLGIKNNAVFSGLCNGKTSILHNTYAHSAVCGLEASGSG